MPAFNKINPVSATVTGVSGHVLGFLDGANTYSNVQTFSSGIVTNSITTASGNLGVFVPSSGLIVVHDSVNGVGLTVGGSSATITGRVNFAPGTSNNPVDINFNNSSNANQGMAISPLGNGQVSVSLPNYSGTYSVPTSNPFNGGGLFGNVIIFNNADTLDASGATSPPTNLNVTHQFGGAGTKGGRWAATFQALLTSDTSDTTNSFYNSGVFNTVMRANAGGSPSSPLGSAFGQALYARLTSGATNFIEVSGREADISIEAGASGTCLHGDSIVLLAANAVAPSIESTGYAVSAQGGALPTIQTAFCVGRQDGTNALSSDGVIVGVHPFQYTGAGPSIAYGNDFRLVTFSKGAISTYGGDIFNDGSVRIGHTSISDNSNGLTLATSGSTGSLSSIATGGTGFTAAPANVTDIYGGIWQISSVSGGVVTGVTLLRPPFVAGTTPANPIVLSSSPGQVGTGLTINVNWSTGTGTVTVGEARTVATLPAASTALKGARTFVTDALTPTFLGTLTGGSSTVCPVFCNGVAWVAG